MGQKNEILTKFFLSKFQKKILLAHNGECNLFKIIFLFCLQSLWAKNKRNMAENVSNLSRLFWRHVFLRRFLKIVLTSNMSKPQNYQSKHYIHKLNNLFLPNKKLQYRKLCCKSLSGFSSISRNFIFLYLIC